MVQQDTLLVSPNLRKFHLDIKNPDDWMPKSQPQRLLSPGLHELTRGNKPDNRWGWGKPEFRKMGMPRCRFCGSEMYLVEETANAFVFGCATENCGNNPDGPFSNYYYERARNRMGKILEDGFGTIYPQDYTIPIDMQKYFAKPGWVTI